MKVPDLSVVMNAMKNKSYVIYDKPNKEWNLNIVGVRASANSPNFFDDLLLVFFRDEGIWDYRHYNITTDPSLYYLNSPSEDAYGKGTSILKEGQYVNAYEIRLHRNKYLALCQRNDVNVTVYRDNNHDDKMDLIPGKEDTGVFGINIHRGPMNGNADTQNSNYSAGCQVFSNQKDFEEFMKICEFSKNNFGNRFTYTLLNEKDLQ